MAERVSPADGARQFLVRWEGYTEADDTWEPAENLLDPQATLALALTRTQSLSLTCSTRR